MVAMAAAAICSLAALATAARAEGNTLVLGNASFWRMHHTLKPPVVDAGGQRLPHRRKIAWLDAETAPPHSGWKEADFDDSGWLRTMGRGGCQTPYLARQCLRGKFLVADPQKVQDLRLTLRFHGGAVVYLNGRELTRSHLPPGDPADDTLAAPYPLEAFVGPSGDLLAAESTYVAPQKRAGKPDEESARRMAARVRSIQEFAIPRSALRRGVNVLAVELLRAPYHPVLLETKEQVGAKGRHNKFDWYTCELHEVCLTAAVADGLVPNAARPVGLQVWNGDPLAADGSLDYGDACEPLRPMRLVGARNGVFSGKVVVGSSKPIAGLRVAASELKGQAGEIAASAVRIRYGYPWGAEAGFSYDDGTLRRPFARQPALFGAMVEDRSRVPSGHGPSVPAAHKSRQPDDGDVVPVWVTVRVPRDARPGLYSGQLTIHADCEAPVAVAVQLDVADYTLPGAQDQRTWVELIEVPDTLAIEYGVPLWSDAHWRMIAESLAHLADSGSRTLYVPALAHTNLGNAESMVRWVRKGENQYDWDFSIMERYLDLAQTHLGQPKVVVLQAWEIYMCTKESVGKRFGLELDERHKTSRGGPLVTVVDPATGKTENVPLPLLSGPPSKAWWKELIGQVRQRLRKRGLEKTLMLGMFTDAIPPKEHIEFFHDIAPDLPWVHQGHGRWKQKVYGIADVGYQATVWGGFRFADGLTQTNQQAPPVVKGLLGWKEPRLDVVFERNLDLDAYPATRWRFFAETAITGELRGIGRIGADYWKAVKGRDGRRVAYASDRFAAGAWSGSWINLKLCNSVLAPGPEGPLATNRLLALIEGVQECEARIAIEQALTDDRLRARLSPALAAECQNLLDRRLHNQWRALSNYQLGGPFFFGAGGWRWTPGIVGHRWFVGSGWQDESKRLFELAGRVERATAAASAGP
jgi:hypothetical protein